MTPSDQWRTALSSEDPDTILQTLKTITREGKRSHTYLPVPLLIHEDDTIAQQAATCLQSLVLHMIPEKRPAHLLTLVTDAISAERGFVALADAEGFQTLASTNIKSEAITHPITQGILASVRESGDYLLTTNTPSDSGNEDSKDEDSAEATSAPPDNTMRSVLVLPIVAADEVISLFYVDTPAKLRAFSADDLALAEQIVHTVAPLLPPHLRSQLFA